MIPMLLVSLAVAQTPSADAALPKEWFGEWRGTLHITGRDEPIPMSLGVEPIDGRDAWTWRITYGEQPPREYTLVPGDAPGRFVIDENNGIHIDARLEGPRMLIAFKVGDTLIMSKHELVGEDLVYEIVSISTAAPRVTHAGEGAQTTKVESFPVNGFQRAVLHRR